MHKAFIKIKNRIYIHKGLVLMLILSFFADKSGIYVKSLLFALFHECAHLCAALILRCEIRTIKMLPFGFEISLRGVREKKKAIIYAAGPVLSMAMGFYCQYLSLYSLAKINFIICMINLVPALPLDGGRLLYCAVRRLPLLKRVSRLCSVFLCCLAFLEPFFLWLFPVSLLIQGSVKHPPFDIFVDDLIKRLEKNEKI